MATSIETDGFRIRVAKYLTRVAVGLFGFAAVAWSTLALPLAWQQTGPKSVATKLLQGQTFKTRSLLAEAEQVEAAQSPSFCDPTTLHNLVLLRIAIFNGSGANHELVDSSYQALYGAAQRALACAPADPFVWLTLFWLNAGKHGFNADNAIYLRLSYALGPNESWIALWRNRLAFALFEQLPADLADDAVEEFVRLVETGRLYWEAATIFDRAPTVGQNRIVERFKTADPLVRRSFAQVLRQKGVDVSIPGESQAEARPWR